MESKQKVSEKEYKKLEREVAKLLIALKPQIGDDYRASDDPHDNAPGMCVTIGATPNDCGTLDWDYQTGDNSYTGGAYGHAHWGIGYLYRRSNCKEVAADIVSEIADSIESF